MSEPDLFAAVAAAPQQAEAWARIAEQALGHQLRDQALAQSQQGREERIQAVRDKLLEWRKAGMKCSRYVTGDDVLFAVEALGFGDGDRRWTASVLKGWLMVKASGGYERSVRPSCHARPKMIWHWK